MAPLLYKLNIKDKGTYVGRCSCNKVSPGKDKSYSYYSKIFSNEEKMVNKAQRTRVYGDEIPILGFVKNI